MKRSAGSLRLVSRAATLALMLGLSGSVFASGPAESDDDASAEASASGSASLDSVAGAGADGDANATKPKVRKRGGRPGLESEDPKRLDVPWIKRWAPEDRMGEIGVFGGVAVIAEDHEFYEIDTDLPANGWQSVARVNADVGLRAGFYPRRMFGFEVDLSFIPMGVPDADGVAMGYGMRAQAVGQLGFWSVVPFATVGAGAIVVSSKRSLLGHDPDETFHLGGGLKFFLTRVLAMRVDFRNDFAPRLLDNGPGTHHQEITLGFSAILGRKRNRGPDDTDGDGILDPVDKCPTEPGVPDYDGCPIPDTDGDSFYDDVDQCIEEAGVEAYEGCPIPDTDGDTFFDDVDECVDEPGVDPDGCPVLDTDGDGFLDDVDECVDEPENENGYEDDDGCPDELPDEVTERFSGVMEGIQFDTGKSTIKDVSKPILDSAIEVLKEYGSVRVEVSGHTDARGKEDKNMLLSGDRANSVRQYLIDAGITQDRVETAGWGPHKPIDTNDTNAGRAKNRRIEFRILGTDEHAPTPEAIQAEISGEADAESDSAEDSAEE